MSWTNLKAAIAAAIKTNNNQEITGAVLQNTLNSIVNSVGANATFAGIATPNTSPGTPDGPTFWIGGPGSYLNFGSPVVEVPIGNIGIFLWNGSSFNNSVLGTDTMKGILASCDLNSVMTTGTWILIEANTYQNTPLNNTMGFLRVSVLDTPNNYSWILQEFYTFDGAKLYKRRFISSGQSFESWADVTDKALMKGILASCDLNNVIIPGTWLLTDANTYQNMPLNNTIGFLRVSVLDTPNNYSWILQEFYTFEGAKLYKRRFIPNSQSFESWADITDKALMMKGILASCDLNSVMATGTWILTDANTYQNTPLNNTIGFLRVSVLNTPNNYNWILQEFYAFNGGKLFKRRFTSSGQLLENWAEVGNGGQSVVNNYTFNEYSQTVSLSATPVITTDTNNYLASTNDHTDRTADILSMLQSTGSCHLGPGIFYIDSLIMPDNSEIVGSGPSTEVYLFEGDNKFAIKLSKRCTVRDLQLVGYAYNISVSQNIGDRHGILWQGNYTQSRSGQNQPQYGTLENLIISRFSGGGITCYDTGYDTYTYVSAVNCHIINCGAGINISYWSEFNKFTNIRCNTCYYGCINNGGNNMFVNCDFSSSIGIAFLMDNSQSQSPNNSHGSCVGCVFNHTANNTGIGIKVLNCANGFIFSGCQIFFSQIYFENSKGLVVSSCNFGENNCDISIDGGNVILFSNNTFQGTPTIQVSNNQYVHFANCYNRNTGAIISN